ncbi:hypothetical protein AVEN_162831-1 [Araneus ventricosus]|uniref:RNase H type-1 domain-containing protein n=1 Tax=Araneus ventricosus TaxID=182803 RepID=A0A4Y2C5T0_ARAVE|nr:hypothetical protein AVEN_162831-1 [Araneus ventricosus]
MPFHYHVCLVVGKRDLQSFFLDESQCQPWRQNEDSVRCGFSRAAEVLSNSLIIGDISIPLLSLTSLTNSRPCAILVLHLQWIPSHVNLKYNDIADSLAKEGTTMPQAHVEPLTYLELYSRRKDFVNISWRHPPSHSWCRSEGRGATIHFKWGRKDQTALVRLTSGHLKTLRFSRGDKKFNICTKCSMIEAIPQHLLDCVVLVYDDLLKRPDFVLEVMKANDLMDLI